MEGLITLLPRVHPVDREVLPLLQHPRLTDAARRALYGVRYWSRVKAAVLASAAQNSGTQTGDFVDRVARAAEAATRTARVDADLLIGITIAAIDLYDHLGHSGFVTSDGPALTLAAMLETPTMVLHRRARLTPEGLFGRFRGDQRQWRVTVEPDPTSTYVVRHGDLLAPCRGGNHERCDVGIVAGAARLSPCEGSEPFPLVRRACETRVFGRISLLTAAL